MCRCARSQRAKASSIAVARWAKLWERAAAKIRPGLGHKLSPPPSTKSTRIDNHVRATAPIVADRRGRLRPRRATSGERHYDGPRVSSGPEVARQMAVCAAM